ncbi:MAG: VTT domain-containing protein [Planctomycetota bacterium]|nr:VTT domain-containing protein [Planctomycetota bacterium]
MEQILDIFLHVDKHLAAFTSEHGAGWVYALIFAIIFLETGVVIMPFLPGDSLLFAAGALAASPEKPIDVWIVSAVIFVAAVVGDAVNYHIGKFLGPRIFRGELHAPPGAPWWRRVLSRAFRKDYLDKANVFYARHGGKAVVLARFIPIIRTFIPFVAGAGAMHYGKFIWYNITGAIAWIVVCVGGGYVFGNLPFVKRNFESVLLGVIFVSLLPMIIGWLRSVIIARRAQRADSGPRPVPGTEKE